MMMTGSCAPAEIEASCHNRDGRAQERARAARIALFGRTSGRAMVAECLRRARAGGPGGCQEGANTQTQ
eukprot:3935680-Pyramimonas_sp.AAC.1